MAIDAATAPTALSSTSRAPMSMRRKLVLVWGLVAGGLAFNALVEWRGRHAFLINTTESLPNWAFFVERGARPARGEYVSFSPPVTRLVMRHFGAQPQPFTKIAYGVAGDVVSRRGNDVLVNGSRVATLKPLSRQGELLKAGPTGIVPAGCVFAATPHKDGFDSRYADIGFVCGARIIGVGTPVL